mmetsp:Transcript_38825/g.116735  ORF Transcript_38825/g.116735 Transcript_38825/m.116735 type:complete len:630 (-) Transcript_38825:429-2318(-)
MMATKPRPAEEFSSAAEAKKPASSADAIQDLERRLMGLGGDEAAEDTKEEAPPAAAAGPPDLLSGPSKPASGGGKGALLSRIMAAQERAKAAQEKQQNLEASLAAHDRKDYLMKALEGKEEEPPPPIEVAEKAAAPPAFDAVKGALPPPASTAAAPPAFGTVEGTLPPSFAAVEQKLPPSFAAVEKSVPPPAAATAPVAAPSAPSLDLHDSPKPTMPAAAAEHSLLNVGIENILAPPTTAAAVSSAPPSFEQIENQLDEQLMDDEAFMIGEDGRPLSAEERKKMMEEQRAIMAAIQKESTDNAAAIAAAQAEAFDQRSGPAVARVAGGGPPPREAERAALVGAEEEGDDGGERTVQIGAGQNVALHGQERTKRAIEDGSAILVECMNCNNWMQVTESATLMFCPVCSVVSPVQKQSEVSTKEEAIQLTRDRQMAERLQAEINAELEGGSRPHRQQSSQSSSSAQGGGFMSNLMGTESSGPATAGASKSWWDTISEYVSVGVSDQAGPGHIAVSRPPGSFAASTDRPRSSPRGAVERQGLLNASVDRSASAASPPRSMQSARVAESKPLFSCIADSITSAATAMGETLTATTLSGDGEGNVHGVDSSSLLVTNAGRQQGGSYHQISDHER